MKIIHNAGLFSLFGLGIAPTAIAQDAGGSSVTLPEVSVSAPADTAFLAPDTASQGVVTGKQIEEQPRSRVGEVLEVVPGLIATQHSGEGKANQYFLRGFNLDHGTDIDITLDDMPVNMRTHGHGQGYADLNFMIPELISTLHYSKGPYFPDLVFPRSRRFRHGRGSANQLPGHAASRPRRGDRRHARLLPRARRNVASGRRRQPNWPRRNMCTPTARGRSRTITTRATWC